MRNCDKFKKLNEKIKMYEKIHFVTCEGGQISKTSF
jgi:hypothetical protein